MDVIDVIDACEVEIDPETATVEISRYVAVDDFGRVVNPMLVQGQAHGGVTQGIGQALKGTCDIRRRWHTGVFSLNEYVMPLATDPPFFKTRTVEIIGVNNELGIKGVGEAGAIAAPPAV